MNFDGGGARQSRGGAKDAALAAAGGQGSEYLKSREMRKGQHGR